MADILRGTVTGIVDGDRFELEVKEIVSDNPDQYDTVERIITASLEDEILPEEQLEEDHGTVDPDDETDGTPEEASIESQRAVPTRFYGVRSKEELEGKLSGQEVGCRVRERNEQAELVADVTLL